MRRRLPNKWLPRSFNSSSTARDAHIHQRFKRPIGYALSLSGYCQIILICLLRRVHGGLLCCHPPVVLPRVIHPISKSRWLHRGLPPVKIGSSIGRRIMIFSGLFFGLRSCTAMGVIKISPRLPVSSVASAFFLCLERRRGYASPCMLRMWRRLASLHWILVV